MVVKPMQINFAWFHVAI